MTPTILPTGLRFTKSTWLLWAYKVSESTTIEVIWHGNAYGPFILQLLVFWKYCPRDGSYHLDFGVTMSMSIGEEIEMADECDEVVNV